MENSRRVTLVFICTTLMPRREMVRATRSIFLSCFLAMAMMVLIAPLVASSPLAWSTRV